MAVLVAVVMVVVAAVTVLVVVVMVVVAAVAVLVVVIMIVMTAVILFVGLLGVELGHQLLCQRGAAGHGGEDLGTGELVPGGGDDDGLGVFHADQVHHFLELFRRHILAAAEHHCPGVLNLVVEELTKILHIHLALLGVDHGDGVTQHHVGLTGHLAHRLGHIGELAYAGGLNEDAVGVVLFQHLAQGLAEVAHQGAADTARVHLGDLNAGVPQETAVDADLPKFVLNQNDFLAGEGLGNEFFNQRGLARPQKAGDNINGSHKVRSLDSQYNFNPYCTPNKGKSKGSEKKTGTPAWHGHP